jgi:excisionase family DNA binding protein
MIRLQFCLLCLLTLAVRSLPADVKPISWAAERLGIADSTAYRLAKIGQIPGAFKCGGQWRISVPRFEHLVHGDANRADLESGQT